MGLQKKLKTAYQINAASGIPALSLMIGVNYGGEFFKHYLHSVWGFERCTVENDIEMAFMPASDIDYIALSGVLPKRGNNAAAGDVRGSWDQLRLPFEQSEIYRSLEQVYLNNFDWCQTPMYKSAYNMIQSGKKSMGCKTLDDLQEKTKYIDSLYNKIRDNGFKSQLELYGKGGGQENKREYQKRMGDMLVPNELRVAIGRSGDIIRVSNARHRVSIMKLLNRSKRIPAIVQFKHTQFDDDLPYESVILSDAHDLVEYSPCNSK